MVGQPKQAPSPAPAVGLEKKAWGSWAGLGSLRLGSARELEWARVEPAFVARSSSESSRAYQAREPA